MTRKNKEILIFKSIDKMSAYAIKQWAGIAENALRERDCFTVALSGGKTPVDLYRKLADQKDLPWDKTHVFMVDERYVPYESTENNFRMINEVLLLHVNIPAKNIHPIITSYASVEAAAAKYEEGLISFFKIKQDALPRFDLILLGLGEDGHTASLFPGTAALKETLHHAVAVFPSDESKKERITLTFPAINNSQHIVLQASGVNKAKVVKEVIELDGCTHPAAMVKPNNGKCVFLLDEDAGSLLSK